MCPHCSKLCCLACMSQWLGPQNRGTRCPHCQSPLDSVAQLVKCRWAGEVTKHLQTMQKHSILLDKHDIKCSAHAGEKIDIYCLDCCTSICHRCALFDSVHFAHTFLTLDEVYESHKASVEQSVTAARERHNQLAALVLDTRHALDELRSAKERRYKQLNMFQYLRARIADKLAPSSSATLSEEQVLTKRATELEAKSHELQAVIEHAERELNQRTKCELIEKSDELIRMCNPTAPSAPEKPTPSSSSSAAVAASTSSSSTQQAPPTRPPPPSAPPLPTPGTESYPILAFLAESAAVAAATTTTALAPTAIGGEQPQQQQQQQQVRSIVQLVTYSLHSILVSNFFLLFLLVLVIAIVLRS